MSDPELAAFGNLVLLSSIIISVPVTYIYMRYFDKEPYMIKELKRLEKKYRTKNQKCKISHPGSVP